MTPSKVNKELESSKEENPSEDDANAASEEKENGNSMEEIDEDELVIKDEIDNECFEEVEDENKDVSKCPI